MRQVLVCAQNERVSLSISCFRKPPSIVAYRAAGRAVGGALAWPASLALQPHPTRLCLTYLKQAQNPDVAQNRLAIQTGSSASGG